MSESTLRTSVVFDFTRFECSFCFARFECSFCFARFECSFCFARFECSFSLSFVLSSDLSIPSSSSKNILYEIYRIFDDKNGTEVAPSVNYTRNEWRWKLHSKRVMMKTTLETSEDENYTRNEWRCKLHSKRVKMKTTLETSEIGCVDYKCVFVEEQKREYEKFTR